MFHRTPSINKDDIHGALKRLGALAQARRLELTLCLLGDAVMIIEYDARKTIDRVDIIILAPSKRDRPNRDSDILELSALVAKEKGWPDNWLNAQAGQSIDKIRTNCLYLSPGIEVHIPTAAQMLALKLLSWNSDVDIDDAIRLLKEMPGNRGDIWQAVEPFLPVPNYPATF